MGKGRVGQGKQKRRRNYSLEGGQGERRPGDTAAAKKTGNLLKQRKDDVNALARLSTAPDLTLSPCRQSPEGTGSCSGWKPWGWAAPSTGSARSPPTGRAWWTRRTATTMKTTRRVTTERPAPSPQSVGHRRETAFLRRHEAVLADRCCFVRNGHRTVLLRVIL